jgi:hypothetical protein
MLFAYAKELKKPKWVRNDDTKEIIPVAFQRAFCSSKIKFMLNDITTAEISCDSAPEISVFQFNRVK